MKNCVLDKSSPFDVAAPSGGVTSGAFVFISAAMYGIAGATAAQGDTVALHRRGAFSGLPKATGAAWTKGDLLYWDNTAKNLTKTATNNTLVGAAYADAQSADAVGSLLFP